MSEGALRAADGSSRWTADLGRFPPVSAAGVLYARVISADRRSELVRAVHAQDGKELWHYSVTSSSIENVTVAGNRVLVAVTKGDGGLNEALTLRALRTSDGVISWQSVPMDVARETQLDTPVPIISSLAVTGERIVAMVADSTGTSYVVAWSLADGSLAWRMPLVATGEADDYAGPMGTATVTGVIITLVYGHQATNTNSILAVDPTTGKRLWTEGGFGQVDFATRTAVVLSNGLAGTIIGLRPQDGAPLWRRDLGPSGDQYAHALSLGTKSDSALFYTRYDLCQPPGTPPTEHVCQLNVYAVGVPDGSLLWQRSVGSSDADFAFTLVYGNDTLYYQRFYDDSAGRHYPLMALRGSDGAIRWTHESNGLFAQALARDGTIFATASACTPGELTCTVFIEALRDRDCLVVWKRIFAPYSGALMFARWIELV